MNINRDKHNKYVAGWTPNITPSTGVSSGSTTSTIIYVGGGSSSGGDSGTVTQQNTFMYYVISDGTNSITLTATIPTDTAILTLIGKNGVTVTANLEKSIPETEFVSTGTNTGTYKISYNKLVTTPDPTEEVPEPQPVTTYPVTITYVSGDKILTSSFDTLTLYNTVDETELVVATYNQTQLLIDGDTTGINSIVADANNAVFSRITLSITVEELTTIILDFAVTVNQLNILYVEGTLTELYWKLDDNGNLYTTYNAYSTLELSAYGMGESGGTPTGAEYLYQLKDVSDAVLTPIDKGILQYNAATSQWEVTDGSNITPDLTGYAKEDWVTQQITNLINILKGNAPENMDTLGEIAGVISSLSDKVTSLEVLLEWFEWDDTNDAIKALFDLYGVGEISAYGYGSGETEPSASYLRELKDVDLTNLKDDGILLYNSSTQLWEVTDGSNLRPDLTGYATLSWVGTLISTAITNLIGGAPEEFDTLGEIATVIQSLQLLLDWFSFVDGKIRANYDLWGVGEISAYGVGEGSSGGKNYLHELEDVLLGDDLASGQLLQYNGTYWVNIDKDEVGLNETELANYLTLNNYLQQGDVTWSNLSGKPSTFNTTISLINDLNSGWDSLLLNPPTDYVTRWPAFSEITDKPTTLAGYGITDAYTKTETDDRYVNITGDTMTGNLTLPALIANDYIRIGSTARLEYDSTNNAIKVTDASGGVVNFYATGEVSAYGMGSESTIVGYLDDLEDVTISSPTNGQALIFNGSQWVNQTIQQGLDEDALYDYLVENNYIQESDLSGYAKSVYVNGSQYNANSSGRITIPDYITRYSVDSDGTQVISTGLRLKDNSNYGLYLYFGDSNYVYLAELTDDDLTIHASDLNLDVDRLLVNGEELLLNIELTTSGSGNIVTNVSASGNTLTVSKGFTIETGSSGKLAYYTGSYTIDYYSSTVGSGTRLWYLSSGTPTNSSSTVGSHYVPVWLSSGTIVASTQEYMVNRNVLTDYSSNWNNVLTAGMYSLSEWGTNGPTNAGYQYGTVAIFQSGSSSNGGAVSLLYMPHRDPQAGIYAAWRTTYAESSSSWMDWHYLLDTGNYANFLDDRYAKKTDNVYSATKLLTARTLWGQSFDGTGNVDGTLTVNGGITLTGNVISDGILDSLNFVQGKTLSSAPTNFQQDVFGTTAWGYKLTAIRWDGTDSTYGARWSPMIAVATNDTSGFITLSSSSADTCYIGGGASSLTWRAKLFNDSMNLIPRNSEYSVGSASIPWYEMHAARFIASDFLQVGSARLYYNTANKAIFVEMADGSQCGFYATGDVSAYGLNNNAGSTTLAGLDDVTISSPSNGQSLVYRNGVWKNEMVSGGGSASVVWSDITGKPSWIGSTKPSYSFSEITGTPSVTLSSNSSTNLTVNVEGASKSISNLYATYLGGTTKQGLFTGLTYSGNRLSATIGGTTKSVTINAGGSVSISSTSSNDLSINVGGSTDSIAEMFASHLRSHYEAVNVPNIDNITYNGIYNWGSNTSGTKPSTGFGVLLHISNYTVKPSTMSWCWRAQLGFGTDGHLFYRISVNSNTWQAWKMIM